ncbi:MAG: hypothetical protein KA527_04700 [Cytophagaceae bacterium]|nr:hypothetical protein [Cytophagaceae bacterium]
MFINQFAKIKNRVRSEIINFSRSKSFYFLLYKCYWRYLLIKEKSSNYSVNYYTAAPNIGAGIGHQIANWIAGYWFAKKFGLKYAHSPFSVAIWDVFLGFGQNEPIVNDLIKVGYKVVKLPLFDEFNSAEMVLQEKIIASYSGQKVIFKAEQDQGYHDQFGVMDALKLKFFNSPARLNDRLIYDDKFLNIAIHIRRGDISEGQENRNPNLLIRWQSNEYFYNVLKNVLASIKPYPKPVAIYLFSQGNDDDFSEFKQFENIHFCLEFNAMDSFLHLVYADILITSKSSFSYKPALLNNGIKISPKDFWHGYPNLTNWIIADESGELLNNILNLDE